MSAFCSAAAFAFFIDAFAMQAVSTAATAVAAVASLRDTDARGTTGARPRAGSALVCTAEAQPCAMRVELCDNLGALYIQGLPVA